MVGEAAGGARLGRAAAGEPGEHPGASAGPGRAGPVGLGAQGPGPCGPEAGAAGEGESACVKAAGFFGLVVHRTRSLFVLL